VEGLTVNFNRFNIGTPEPRPIALGERTSRERRSFFTFHQFHRTHFEVRRKVAWVKSPKRRQSIAHQTEANDGILRVLDVIGSLPRFKRPVQ
jgi:hypothetical protein